MTATTPYEKLVVADMETMLLRFGADLGTLITELHALPAAHRRAAVVYWMNKNHTVAAIIVEELAGFCAALVDAAAQRQPPKAWPPA